MTSTKDSIAARVAGRWATLAIIATACLTLTACSNGFEDGPLDTEAPSSCASGRLGCVTDHNIAMAVARPSDLAVPRRQQPRDSLRRDAVLTAYRQGATLGSGGSGATGITLQGGSR